MGPTCPAGSPPPLRGDEAELFRTHHRALLRLVARDIAARAPVIEDAGACAWLELIARQPERTNITGRLRLVARREAIRLARHDRRLAPSMSARDDRGLPPAAVRCADAAPLAERPVAAWSSPNRADPAVGRRARDRRQRRPTRRARRPARAAMPFVLKESSGLREVLRHRGRRQTPVNATHPGGLLFLGDVHASQGCGRSATATVGVQARVRRTSAGAGGGTASRPRRRARAAGPRGRCGGGR